MGLAWYSNFNEPPAWRCLECWSSWWCFGRCLCKSVLGVSTGKGSASVHANDVPDNAFNEGVSGDVPSIRMFYRDVDDDVACFTATARGALVPLIIPKGDASLQSGIQFFFSLLLLLLSRCLCFRVISWGYFAIRDPLVSDENQRSALYLLKGALSLWRTASSSIIVSNRSMIKQILYELDET